MARECSLEIIRPYQQSISTDHTINHKTIHVSILLLFVNFSIYLNTIVAKIENFCVYIIMDIYFRA